MATVLGWVLPFLCVVLVATAQSSTQRQSSYQSECRLERVNAEEPSKSYQSEAGLSEYWEQQNSDQLRCAGVDVARHTIEPQGLLLPHYTNAPRLAYIIQGRGIFGAIVPGCPESFQSIQQQGQSGSQSRSYSDQHQKIRRFRRGDMVALPAGVAYWFYNDGDQPLVTVTLYDTSNSANQLDENLRSFLLAGSKPEEHPQRYQRKSQESSSSSNSNIFGGFDDNILMEALAVSHNTVQNLKNQNNNRGAIVRVKGGLQLVNPPRSEEEETRRGYNGLEELTFCNSRLVQNIEDPSRADVYTPQAGRTTSLNSRKLPILNHLNLNAERVVLYKNALTAPRWNLNAHSILYVTRGSGHVEVVNNRGNNVYSGELREGQLLVVPQQYAVVKKAGNEGFEYIAFKTNDIAMTNPIVGKASVFLGLPLDVLMSSYDISREEASHLKYNRAEEMRILTPRRESDQSQRASA